jgi:aminocarboxymuconate-semialdehyde decarboxylase
MIGSNVDGRNLDDPALEPLWQTANDLEAFILIHPVKVAGAERMRSYYLGNLIGNPLDTTIAAACLIFGGLLESYPKINFCLAHGGGFLPYQAGRWVHGWQVREEPKAKLKHAPDELWRRFYFDSILHSRHSLEFLVESVGASHVLLGSDYPFDMGTLDCARQVRALPIADNERAAILGANAAGLLDSRQAQPRRAGAG